MNIGAVGFSNLATQMQSANQSFAANTLKTAMNDSQQFLQLLEQSINVTNVENIASELGMNVDVRV